MKNLKEHILENIVTEGNSYTSHYINYDERRHQVILQLCNAPDLTTMCRKFDEIGLDLSSEEEEFDYAKVRIDYKKNTISLEYPNVDNNYGLYLDKCVFKTRNSIMSLHDTTLYPDQLKLHSAPARLDKQVIKEIVLFLCWIFNNTPTPIFNTPIK